MLTPISPLLETLPWQELDHPTFDPLPARVSLSHRLVRMYGRDGDRCNGRTGVAFDDEVRAMPSVDDREIWIRAPEIAVRLATIVAVSGARRRSRSVTSSGLLRSPGSAPSTL